MRTSKAFVFLFAVMLLMSGFSAANGAEHHQGPRVFPPGSSPHGQTYGEWSADWWEQVFETPASSNPLSEEGAVTCDLGADHVVFLIGTLGGTVRRSCTVPRGTALFLPLVNAECSTAERNGETPSKLRACARDLADTVDSVNARVDGKRVKGLFKQFRFTSPAFTVDFPEDNILGVPAGDSLVVADGYWVMLRPLAPGHHRVSFGGTAGGFSTQVTYRLTVRGR